MSQTSSTYVWRYEREGGPDGRPSAPLEHGDRSRLRAVMASSEFPGSHGPGNGKRGGGRDLRPSTPSKGKKRKKVLEGPFRTAPDGDGGGHRRTAGQGGERAGLPSLAAHPAASTGVPMPRGFLRKGTL